MQLTTPTGILVFRNYILAPQEFEDGEKYSAAIEISDAALQSSTLLLRQMDAAMSSRGGGRADFTGLKRQGSSWLLTARSKIPPGIYHEGEELEGVEAHNAVYSCQEAAFIVEPYGFNRKEDGVPRGVFHLVGVAVGAWQNRKAAPPKAAAPYQPSPKLEEFGQASTPAVRPLLLVDASNYLHRAYHAAKKDGGDAVEVMEKMLAALKSRFPHAETAAVFDAPGETFRHKLFPGYKADRKDAEPELDNIRGKADEMAAAACDRLWKIEGVEADDVIATLSRHALGEGREVLIASSDKDLKCLLAAEGVRIINPATKAEETAEDVEKKFGVRPSQLPDVLAIAGDAADCIPGVPGAGVKTAAKWVKEFGGVEGLVASAADIKGKGGEKLRASIDQLLLSRKLVSLKDDVDLGDGRSLPPRPSADPPKPPPSSREAKKAAAEAAKAAKAAEREAKAAKREEAKAAKAREKEARKKEREEAKARRAADKQAAKLRKAAEKKRKRRMPAVSSPPTPPVLPRLAFLDIETASGLNITAKDVDSTKYFADPQAELLCALYKMAGKPDCLDATLSPLVGLDVCVHNLGFDFVGLAKLAPETFKNCRFLCSQAVAWAINLERASLNDVLWFLFGDEDLQKIEVDASKLKEIPRQEMLDYCFKDVRLTELALTAMRMIWMKAAGEEFGKESWAQMVKEQLLHHEINARGLPLDEEFLEAAWARAQELEKEAKAWLASRYGTSNKNAVFEKMREAGHLPPSKEKTAKKQEDTKRLADLEAADVLDREDEVGKDARALEVILNQALYKKLLRACQLSHSGRAYFVYNFCKAFSGRFSSSGIAVQNIPRWDAKVAIKDDDPREAVKTCSASVLKKSMRRMIRAPKGRLLVELDLTGIELRIAMHWIGRDDVFAKDAEGNQRDLYCELAATAFKPAGEGKTFEEHLALLLEACADKDHPRHDEMKELRRRAKAAVLGKQYGLGAKTWSAREDGLSEAEAQNILDAYLKMYPAIGKMQSTFGSVWGCGGDWDEDVGDLPGGLKFAEFPERKMKVWRLPSGRPIIYWFTGHRKGKAMHGMHPLAGSQSYKEVHPGMLNAHIISGAARDVLCHAMQAFDDASKAEKIDAALVGSLHDAIIVESSRKDAPRALELLRKAMTTPPSWMPDIELDVEGGIVDFIGGEDIDPNSL